MKSFSLSLLVFISSLNLFSQIKYTDPDDVTISTWEVHYFHLTDTSAGYLQNGTINIWFHPWAPNQVVALTGSYCQLMVDNLTDAYPLKLNAGDTISSTKNWASVSYKALNIGNSEGHWLNGVTDGYLGIRFKYTSSGKWLYGWARLDVNNTPDSFTLKDYACQTNGDKTNIIAGQIASGVSEKAMPLPFETYLSGSGVYYKAGIRGVNFKGKFTLSNISGQVVYESAITNASGVISIPENLKGIYFAGFFFENGACFIRKLVLN